MPSRAQTREGISPVHSPGSTSASRSSLHHDRSLSINEGCRFSSHQDRRVQKAFGIVTGWVASVSTRSTGTQKFAPLQGGDLVWDTSGERNCWIGNNYKTSFPPALPACFANER